jgi:hypothetical protein
MEMLFSVLLLVPVTDQASCCCDGVVALELGHKGVLFLDGKKGNKILRCIPRECSRAFRLG